jgi:hypothetical protein
VRTILDRSTTQVRRYPARTDKIRGLAEFIAQGDRSEYMVSTLRDLETYPRAEKAMMGQLVSQAQEPLKLPTWRRWHPWRSN